MEVEATRGENGGLAGAAVKLDTDARGKMHRDASGQAPRPSNDAPTVHFQHIEDVLAEQGVFVSTTVGVSMWPMLRNRRDTIVVKPLGGRRLRRFEIPLYRRGDAYVLHRCIEVHENGYTMLGDNCISKEPNVSDAQVIGVLAQCYRGGRELNLEGLPYRAYMRTWCALFPARRAFMRLRHAAGKVAQRALSKRKTS